MKRDVRLMADDGVAQLVHCTPWGPVYSRTHSEHANSKQIADRATSPCVRYTYVLIS